MSAYEQSQEQLNQWFKSFGLDGKGLSSSAKNIATLNEQLTKAALSAAEKSAEVSGNWNREVLDQMASGNDAGLSPPERAEAATRISSEIVKSSSRNMQAYAEIARELQKETMALLIDASRGEAKEASGSDQSSEAEAKTDD
ncbi:MAG: hypothetical protein OXB95_04880 [Rhodobacteraceae bacterium]|nr:hypothetical protein [Paracoccaceae bacterium]